MSRDTIIRLLLRIYPRAWRSEFEEELGAILRDRPFTPSTIGDVVLCGVRERLRYAEVWQIWGAALALWLTIGIIANSLSPFSRAAYEHFSLPEGIVALAIGYIYVARYHRHPAAAALASVKASLLGIIPELLLAALWAANLIHPTILDMNGSPHLYGRGITELCVRTDATVSPATLLLVVPLTGLAAFLSGLVGATVAMGVSAARRLVSAQK